MGTPDTIMRLGAPSANLQASRTRGDVAPLNIRWDVDGRGYIYAYTGTAAFTAKAKCKLIKGQYGWTACAVSDTGATQYTQYVAFPQATYATGVFGWFQVAGCASDVIITTTTGTVGHAVKLATDTVVTTGAAPSGLDNEFGVFLATGATATYNILMFPIMIDGAD